MTVLYGPDGLPITAQKEVPTEVPTDVLAVHQSDMATDPGRQGVMRMVREWHMGKVVDRARIYDLVARHDSRVSLEASDEHGDMQVLFEGKPVKLKLHKDVAEQLGYWDPTSNKVPEYQKDL